MDVKLSLIIPIYNAEAFILDTLMRLNEWKQKISYSVQIILVDDGSKDSTKKIAENYIKANDLSIEILSYKVNQGKGYAVKHGMLAGVGKYKIFTDADIPFGFEVINTMLYYLDFKEFDVCIGNRKSVNSIYFTKMSLIRKLSSRFFTMVISRYVVTGVTDTQCGLKGFKAEVADLLFSKLQTKGFAFDVEILYLCYKYEFDIKKIPVVFVGNDISTINLTKNSIQMLYNIICLPFRYHFSNKY